MKAIHFDKKNARDLESEKSDLSIASLCNSAGILTCVCLIGYFFLMSAFKLQEVLALRAFNFIIISCGVLWALRFYRKATEEDKIEYFTGLKIGVRVVLTSVIAFAIFMALYLVYDARLMDIIRESTGVGDYINPLTVAGALCIEGLGSGVIITFIAMQYYKKE